VYSGDSCSNLTACITPPGADSLLGNQPANIAAEGFMGANDDGRIVPKVGNMVIGSDESMEKAGVATGGSCNKQHVQLIQVHKIPVRCTEFYLH